MVFHFEYFVLNNDLGQNLDAVSIYLQIIHSYDRDDIVDDATAETNFT